MGMELSVWIWFHTLLAVAHDMNGFRDYVYKASGHAQFDPINAVGQRFYFSKMKLTLSVINHSKNAKLGANCEIFWGIKRCHIVQLCVLL